MQRVIAVWCWIRKVTTIHRNVRNYCDSKKPVILHALANSQSQDDLRLHFNQAMPSRCSLFRSLSCRRGQRALKQSPSFYCPRQSETGFLQPTTWIWTTTVTPYRTSYFNSNFILIILHTYASSSRFSVRVSRVLVNVFIDMLMSAIVLLQSAILSLRVGVWGSRHKRWHRDLILQILYNPFLVLHGCDFPNLQGRCSMPPRGVAVWVQCRRVIRGITVVAIRHVRYVDPPRANADWQHARHNESNLCLLSVFLHWPSAGLLVF